jgi:hypothetical protein
LGSSSCCSSHLGLLLFSCCYYFFPHTAITFLPLLLFSPDLVLLFSSLLSVSHNFRFEGLEGVDPVNTKTHFPLNNVLQQCPPPSSCLMSWKNSWSTKLNYYFLIWCCSFRVMKSFNYWLFFVRTAQHWCPHSLQLFKGKWTECNQSSLFSLQRMQ